jgi:VWFA-related protein
MFRNRLVPSLVAILLAVLPAAAQGPVPQDKEETFFESIDVQVVNIDVFVTDRQDKRVAGLTRDDFEILEDGKPVEITNFYAVSGGRSEEAETEPAAAPTPVEAAQPEPAGQLPPEQRLHLAIVIDDLTLTAPSRNRMLQSIEKEVLPRLQPDDFAMVGVIDGSSIRLAQGLTADPNQIRTALTEAMRSAPQGSSRIMDKREILSRIDSVGLQAPGETPGGQMNAAMIEQLYYDLKSYAAQRTAESRASLGALSSFVDSLSGLPGRKAVLYVGGGLSVRPAEAFFQAWQSKFGTAARSRGVGISMSAFDGQREDLTKEFQELVDHANANRVTFYSLGALEELSGVGADTRTSGVWGSQMENLEKMNLQQSLDRIAIGTGGLSAVDLIDPRSLFVRMREDFDSYYSLGYVPARRRDGKNRKIEVRIRSREDLRVRNREGRRDQTNRERMADRTLAALVLDAGANPLELAVDFIGEKSEKDQYLVEVLVKFPLAKLVLLPKERFHEGQVTLFVGARDSRGRMSPIQAIDVPIRVPNDQLLTALGQTAAYKTTLRMRNEAHTVAVSIRDELGNADSAIAVPYTPGKKG